MSDEQATTLAFIEPKDDMPEVRYLKARRNSLGGWLPMRNTSCPALPIPALPTYAAFALEANGKDMSTTMAFVRALGQLLKAPEIGPRVVPIVADEARTFGMASLFKQVGIYSSVGQRYEPEDIGSILSYREDTRGQILEEGISEAGAIASWTAAATSYSVHGYAMIPFYIYYSMFGFQRVGDAIWAAADQRARGFLMGATSGRTTLAGEGLQHQDGSSRLLAATIPNCKAYDPAFACELAVILDAGLQEMYVEQQDVFYYITLMNESYANPSLVPHSQQAICKGGYLYQRLGQAHGHKVTLMGSGAILTEVIQAAHTLANSHGLQIDVMSVTSWSELAREADRNPSQNHLRALLHDCGPLVVAASDYVRAVPESIRAHIPSGTHYSTLGTDGFGLSDTRQNLRNHFGVSAQSIVKHVLSSLPLLN